MSKNAAVETQQFDPVLLAVLGNRLDSICREMTNTLLRTGRSTVLSVARDFSCSIVTSDHRLLAAADGMPVHIFGSQLLTRSIDELRDDVVEGDAILHNDPYNGNTHAADHTIVVPVFHHGERTFWVCAKAHQADCGNSVPSTYMPGARDVYEEGALIFPAVKVQSNYTDNQDIIRMCKARIRAPQQWYGDYLAALGAARTGARRLEEVLEKYGADLISDFIEEWLNYSERRFRKAVSRLPALDVSVDRMHDPFPNVEDGIPLHMDIKIAPDKGEIQIDLRNNIDAVPAGLNESMACAINNGLTGVLNALGDQVPANDGMFRCVEVLLRENSVAGIPVFPTSVSMATTNVGDRLVNAGQSVIAESAPGFGLAEGGTAAGIGIGVISGHDPRAGAAYVSQILLASNGGPAGPNNDGWVNYGSPVIAGMMYRDSVEVDEQKYPLLVKSVELLKDSSGHGKHRGAPAQKVVYGPRGTSMEIVYNTDGGVYAPKGVLGGTSGTRASAGRIDRDGRVHELPLVGAVTVNEGDYVIGISNSGGGYGEPHERDEQLVLDDVREGFISIECAERVYGIVIEAVGLGDTLEVNRERTETLRRTA